jgi:hypothetical protein
VNLTENRIDKIIKERYKNVPIGVIDEYKQKIDFLKLDPENEIFIQKKTDDSEGYFIIIARDAYRRIAQSDSEYLMCYSFPVYSKDMVEIDNSIILHKLGLDPRGDLIGAYGILYKNNFDRPFIQYASLQEFTQKVGFWDPVTGIPAFMVCKIAEVQVIKSAYATLFSNTYSEDEIKIRGNKDTSDRAKIIEYCRDNMSILKDVVKKDISDATTEELMQYKEYIIKNKGEKRK